MVDVFDRHGVRFDPRLAGCSMFVRYSDYAALEAQLAERVKVKPLEWVELNEGKAFRALLPVIGSIRIEPYGVCGWWEVLWSMPGQCDKLIPDVFDTPDEAKAAAQADYERRILSAIEAPAAEGEKRELTAVEELAVSMTDEKIANALDEECETILQLLIYSREGEIASHVGAIKSWTGMLRGRAERMPKARPSLAAASEVTEEMVERAAAVFEKEMGDERPCLRLIETALIAALKGDR